MSRRNKLQKFADLRSFPNVYENTGPRLAPLHGPGGVITEMKGKWGEQHFGNTRPIVLELACGRGEYTLGLARQYPDRNFIGVDIKGARIWQGARIAIAEGLNNAAFLRIRIEHLPLFFAKGEVSEIWITFPDPFLRQRKSNRRLTAPVFLSYYKEVLRAGGAVHLKTDEPNLYEFTLEVLAEQPNYVLEECYEDIYAAPLTVEELAIKTYYERMHLSEGKSIKYARFRLVNDKTEQHEATRTT